MLLLYEVSLLAMLNSDPLIIGLTEVVKGRGNDDEF